MPLGSSKNFSLFTMIYFIFSSILEGYQANEMAGSCDIHKENKAAADWFSNTAEEGDFEPADKLPKYHWFLKCQAA